MSIRRIILGASLTTLVAVVAGCGGSGSSNAGPSSVARPVAGTPVAETAAGIAPPVARGLAARAQYAGFARAINLRPGDVPGFIAEHKKPKRFHLHNKAFENDGSQYRRCFAFGTQGKPLPKVSSDKFARGGGLHSASVSSEVEIAPTIARAQRELAAARRILLDPSTRGCLTRAFDGLGSQNQAIQLGKGRVRGSMRIAVGNLHITPLALGSMTRGTDGAVGSSVAMTVTYTVSARGRTLTVPTSLHFDELAVLLGRGEVTLATVTLGDSFPPELEARLFSLLVSRALSASQVYPTIEK